MQLVLKQKLAKPNAYLLRNSVFPASTQNSAILAKMEGANFGQFS